MAFMLGLLGSFCPGAARILVAAAFLSTFLSSSTAQLLDVHRVATFGSNIFLLETRESLFLVDAGYPGQEARVLRRIERIGKTLKLIVLTHAHMDHYGSAAEIRRQTGAQIAAHELDIQYLSRGETPLDSVRGVGMLGKMVLPVAEAVFHPEAVEPDIILKDGDSLDQFGLQARIIHTPGHTPGSCSIIVEDRIAFAGDLVTKGWGFSKQQFFASNWKQIDTSLLKLCRSPFRTVYIGHLGERLSRRQLLELSNQR